MGTSASANPSTQHGPRKDTCYKRGVQAMTELRDYNKKKYGTVPPHISDYPPPAPPSVQLDHVYQPLNNSTIDEAVKETPHDKFFDFPALVDHLTDHLKTDVQKVRAIFAWLGHQDLQNTIYPDDIDPYTPVGYLKRVQSDSSLYVPFFALLCREADIPCVILTGKARDTDYEAGDRECSDSTWNAVYVEGGWRLVHCIWALTSVVDRTAGGWLKVEEDGKKVHQDVKKNEGKTKYNVPVNDSYFFIPPEVFIYFCLPDDSKWQLLSSPVSQERFFAAPFVSPQYFESGFSFRKGQAGVLSSQKGECSLVIKAHQSWRRKLKYVLCYKKNITHRFPHSTAEERYVAVLNKNDRNEIKIQIRFRIEGHYRLSLYELNRESFSWICDFKLQCDERRAVQEPFPESPPSGWGPGSDTVKAGLYNISHREGLIEVKYRSHLEISFNTKGKRKITAFLTHVTRPRNSVTKCLSVAVRNDHVKIKVTPDEGEYALIINACTPDVGESNVLNYIIVAGKANKKSIGTRETTTERKIRERLLEATREGEKDDLSGCIEKFVQLRMADRGHLTAARQELEVVEIREGLRVAIMRRREDELKKAISRAKASSMTKRVQEDMERAEKVLNSLQYQRTTHRYGDTTVTPQDVADLRAIRVLSPPIKEVFMAVFLLLGENRWNLQDPYNLLCLMKQSGSDGLLSRLENFNPEIVQPDVVEDATRLLEKQQEDKLIRISLPVGKMYQEGKNLIEKCTRKTQSLQQNMNSPRRVGKKRREKSM